MKLKRIQVSREVHGEGALQGRFLLGDALEKLDALAKEYAGQVKLIYLAPPFLTGERFVMRVRVGESEWKTGKGSLALESFVDQKDRSAFLTMMRRVLTEYDRRILMKPPGAGCAELRAAIAAYLERSRGVAVSPKRIIIG